MCQNNIGILLLVFYKRIYVIPTHIVGDENV